MLKATTEGLGMNIDAVPSEAGLGVAKAYSEFPSSSKPAV